MVEEANKMNINRQLYRTKSLSFRTPGGKDAKGLVAALISPGSPTQNPELPEKIIELWRRKRSFLF